MWLYIIGSVLNCLHFFLQTVTPIFESLNCPTNHERSEHVIYVSILPFLPPSEPALTWLEWFQSSAAWFDTHTKCFFLLAFSVILMYFLLLHFMLSSILISQKLFYFSDVASGVFLVCFNVWAFYLLYFLLDFEASGAVFGRHTHSFWSKAVRTFQAYFGSLTFPVHWNRPKPIKYHQFLGLFCAILGANFENLSDTALYILLFLNPL